MTLLDAVTKEVIPESAQLDANITEFKEKYAALHKQILSTGLVKPRAIADLHVDRKGNNTVLGNVARIFGHNLAISDVAEIMEKIPFAIVLGYAKQYRPIRMKLHDYEHAAAFAPYWYCVYIPEVFYNRVAKLLRPGKANIPIPLTAVAMSTDIPDYNISDINMACGMRGLVKPKAFGSGSAHRGAVGKISDYIDGHLKFDPSIKRLPGAWAAELTY